MASLEDQKKLLQEIAEIEARIEKGIKIQQKTRDTYNQKLKESAALQKSSIESNKIDQGIQKDISKLQKDIVKSNQSKVGMLLKGNIQGILEQKNMSKTLGLQLQIKQSQEIQGKTLSTLVGKGKITIGDRNKLLKINKGISDGTTNEADIAGELNGLSQKGLKLRRLFELQGKKNIDLRDDENEASERANELQEKMNAAFVKGAAIFGVLASIATKFGASIDKIGQTFGSLSVMGEPFKKDLLDASVQATQLGGGIEDVAAITNTLASNFGMNVDEAAKLSSKVFDTSKAIGLSGDEAANLFGTLMQTANLSADQAESLAEGAFQLARQKGVAPSAVLKDIAGSAEEIAVFTKDGGDNIAEAAVQARQMGLSLSTSAKIAEGLLDFESSIAGEMEASIMIGKQLNFQKARQLALEGDIAGATKNIVDQVGSEAEFNKLNALQRQSLAKSIGVSVSEMSKLVSGSEKLTLSGAMASSSFGDLLGEEGISNISSLIGKFKSLGATLVNTLGPTFETILGNFNKFFANKENMDNLIGGVKSLASFFTLVAKNIDLVIGAFLGLKVGMMAFTIAQTVMQAANLATAASSAIAGGAAAGAATGPAAPIMIPLLIAGALAAVTAAVATFGIPSFDKMNPMSGAVVKGGTQNKAVAQIQGGEGVFQEKGLQEMFGGFGAQNAHQRSFGLTSADAEMIGTAMASKISLKTDVSSGNLQMAMNSAINPPAGTPLVRDFS